MTKSVSSDEETLQIHKKNQKQSEPRKSAKENKSPIEKRVLKE